MDYSFPARIQLWFSSYLLKEIFSLHFHIVERKCEVLQLGHKKGVSQKKSTQWFVSQLIESYNPEISFTTCNIFLHMLLCVYTYIYINKYILYLYIFRLGVGNCAISKIFFLSLLRRHNERSDTADAVRYRIEVNIIPENLCSYIFALFSSLFKSPAL